MQALISSIVGIINGLIVGVLSFVLGLLDSLDSITSLIQHGISSIEGLITTTVSLTTNLLPFIPAEWVLILETVCTVLLVGMFIKKKVTK